MDASSPEAPSSEEAANHSTFPVVGIGASAGGLEALQKLLGRLTSDGMAFVVVQHLAAGRESALSEILARSTKVPVAVMKDGQRIEPNVIYVAPPDADVSIDGDRLCLQATRLPEVPRRTIDNFMQSLATQRQRAAIGMVLSGTGSDGTIGLRRIKEEGGITFVQDPTTAMQPGMPQSAIEAGVADFCLSPEEIGDELMRLSAHPFIARGELPHALDADKLAKIFELLRGAFGVDFAGYKRGTIERRIERRMALHKIDLLPDYLGYLESNPHEPALLYSDLLISVTAFFRDSALFESLKSTVFPRIVDNRSADVPIRMWVPGCASGEEAYSLAMAMLEFLGDRANAFKVQIFATDIDEQALARGRRAVYPRSVEVDLSAERLERFFTVEDQGYRVSRRVRDIVVFARHNLGKDPPFSHLDLVSCRNVLIYMQPPLQRRILRILHYALNPGGILVLGLSESIGEAIELFAPTDRKLKIFSKQNIVAIPAFELGFSPRGREIAPAGPAAPTRPLVSVQQIADRRVLDRYAPPGVLVNDSLDILQFRGQTGPFLAPIPGAATLNLLKLVRSDLVPTLRATLHEAAESRLPATSPPTRLTHGERATELLVDVIPLASDAGGGAPCYVVLFRETPLRAPGEAGEAPGPAAPAADPRLQALDRELEVTKQSLQSTIDELEASNEELQSSNEELQSSNEELQSTNEELETSKEELQSTNEELATVNDELQSRMSQLSIMSDDLKNLLAGTASTVLLVGNDLRIREFSAAAGRLLNLIPSDSGRPVAYIRTVMMARDLEQTVSQVIATVTPREGRVRGTDGIWYTMRILPYKTADNAIRGALIEFVRAPTTARAPLPGELGDLSTEVLALLPQALMLLDDQLRVFWGNRAFFELFRIEADVFGRPLDELWDGRNRDPELWTLLEEVAAGGPPISHVVVEHPLAADAAPMSFAARRLQPAADRPALTLVIIEPLPRGTDAAG